MSVTHSCDMIDFETRLGHGSQRSVWIVPRKDGDGVFSVEAAGEQAANRTYASLPRGG